MGFKDWKKINFCPDGRQHVLRSFQDRKRDVRPGDALRYMVTVEMRYGYDNELISETYVVNTVIDVLEDTSKDQDGFFD